METLLHQMKAHKFRVWGFAGLLLRNLNSVTIMGIYSK